MKSKNVLVTGANGHVGYTLTQMLVERGYRVRAGMRNVSDERKSAPLRELGVEIVELDITNPGQVEAAVQGIDGVFHVAAVLQMAGDPEAIIRPTVEGAMSVVRAAHAAGVGKIIYTSSGRTLGNSSPPNRPLDDSSWNDRARVPYSIAKTEAEKQIWAYARQHNINLVSINPLMILGPNIHRLSESTMLIDTILNNRYPIIPPIYLNIADVRDVALAHILAYENHQANGRYIVGSDPICMAKIFALVNAIHPIRIPSLKLSVWVFRLYAHIMAFVSRQKGQPPQITVAQAYEMTEGPRYVDTSKTHDELGLAFHSPEETIRATVKWLEEHPVN
ncbi:MAG: NAD-dependent epimerase/dehydratase family protein [Anaerolineae bacterium]|nr:NAD-dependent epimerase/dehydratase family protein [Anaerolineae bacterium]